MFLAGGSFTLYYRALRKDVKPLLVSTEFRIYGLDRARRHTVVRSSPRARVDGTAAGFRDSMFTMTSTITTTGYVTSEYGLWSQAVAGADLDPAPDRSDGRLDRRGREDPARDGGVELRPPRGAQHLHPRLVRPVRVGTGILSDDVAGKVVGFLLLALVIFGGGSFLIAATGPDVITSFSASATSIGNVGPGLGDIDHSGDFLAIPRAGRAIAMLQMLLGSPRDLPGDPRPVGRDAAPPAPREAAPDAAPLTSGTQPAGDAGRVTSSERNG